MIQFPITRGMMKEKIKSVAKPHYIISVLAISSLVLVSASSANPPLFQNTDNFVILAQEEIKIEKEIQISSGDVGSNKEIAIDKDSIVIGNLFADKISIGNNSQINGNVSYNKLEIREDATILGTKTDSVSLPIAELSPITDFPIGDRDFKFEGKGNTLVQDNYRDIILEKDAELTLTGGTYNLNCLELKENSTLIFSAPTILNIKKELKGKQRIAVLSGNNNLKPTDLTIHYVGKNKDKNKEKEEGFKPIEFGEYSFLNLKLHAPKAEVHIGQNSTIRGQILGRKIKLEKGGVMSRELSGIKITNPANIITDSNGGVYPINEILVSLIQDATLQDAKIVARSINGRIVGVINSINLYQIEIQARTISELENLINNLRANQVNLKIDGIFRNFSFPEQ